jgi:hypothetical protein
MKFQVGLIYSVELDISSVTDETMIKKRELSVDALKFTGINISNRIPRNRVVL